VKADLRAVTERQRSLMDALPYAAWMTDITGRYLEVNDAFLRWTGSDRDVVLGAFPTQVLPAAEARVCEPRWVKVITSGTAAIDEHRDPATGRTYAFEQAPYRDEQGRIQGAVGFRREITDVIQRRIVRRHQTAFRALLMDLAVGFVNIPVHELDVAIERALGRVGSFAGVDRAYVFVYDHDASVTSNTHEWCAPAVTPEREHLQSIPFDAVQPWVDRHLRGLPIHIEDVLALPEDDPVRAVLEPQGVLTLIALPIMDGEHCLGFVGFDAVTGHKHWEREQRQLLEVLAEMLANALLRRERERALARSNAALERAQRRLELALHWGSEAIWEWEAATNHLYASPRFNELLGLPSTEQLVAWDVGASSLIRADEALVLARSIEEARARGDDRFESEVELRHADGRPVPVVVRGAVVWGENGQPSRIAGTVVDLARARSLEAQALRRQRVDAALVRSSARFVSGGAVEDAIDALLEDLGRAYAADRCYLLGTDDERRLSSRREWCLPGTPSVASETQRIGRETLGSILDELEAGAPLIVDDVTALGPERDAERCLYERQGIRSLLAVPLHVNGTLIGVLGIDHLHRPVPWSDTDAALLRAAGELVASTLSRAADQAELVTAREAAERANAAKTRFLSTISHELRTPMNGVLGMAELLLHDDLSGDQRQRVDAVRASASTLLTLLDDLLDVARVEGGRLELSPAPTDLGLAVRSVIGLAEPEARRKGLELSLDLDPGLIAPVLLDEARTRQIISNLVGNAVKFTEHGTVRVRCERAGPVTDGRQPLRLLVEDSGPGMTAAVRARAFEPFSQGDRVATRTHGGSGLGLAIVKQLVELMGGEILLDSVLGIGTRIEVRLAPAVAPVQAWSTAPMADDADVVRARGLRVLVAEDNLVNQQVARGYLQALGCDIEVVDDGVAAIRAHTDLGPYDVILMDCYMPEVDGMAATREIRRHDRSTPIIAVTADAAREHAELCRDAGMSDVLPKPYDRRSLAAVLARWTRPTAAGGREPTEARASQQARDDHAADARAGDADAGGVRAADAAGPPEDTVLDTTALRALLAQHPPPSPLVEQVLELFREHAPGYLTSAREGLAGASLEDARRAVHTLRSNAATVGLVRLGGACQELEDRLRDALRVGEDTGAGLVASLLGHVDELEDELHAGLAALASLTVEGLWTAA
ncbi:MAG: GAF domain-containing protein, partial [Nitriliruptoraceae bacterium]